MVRVFLTWEQHKTPESIKLALDTFQRCGSAEPRAVVTETSFPLHLGSGALGPPPRGRPPTSAPASRRLHGRPVRTIERCSADTPSLRAPAPTPRPPPPAPRRQAGLSARLLSLTGRPGQRAPTAPHGSWAPRASRFRPAPWQATQVAEPRNSGPTPAARTTSRRCPLGTDQQQDGGQPRGRGPGVIVTWTAKNPPPAQNIPNQQPLCPTPRRVPPADRSASLSVRPCLSRPVPNASARDCDGTGWRMRAVPGVAGGRAFTGYSESVPPLASLSMPPPCAAGSVFFHACLGNVCCVLHPFFF